jgi:uncharacterized protein with NRDE domain
MCLLFFCRNADPQYPLILLANRDEFYERPTRAAGFWDEAPSVLAGRDLRRGGTWLGITRSGRWAALTNYREPSEAAFNRSRGDIVRDYLTGEQSARDFSRRIQQIGDEFDGFNLLLGDRREALWLSNRGDGAARALENGIYGLSNHLLETPWPKVVRGKDILRARLGHRMVTDSLFDPLKDQTVYEDGLPDTGIGPETEKLLSSAFISSETYGTRSSSLIVLDRLERVYFEERSYQNPTGGLYQPDEYCSKIYRFRLDSQ